MYAKVHLVTLLSRSECTSGHRHTVGQRASTRTQSQRIMASSRPTSCWSVVWQPAGGGVTFSLSISVQSSSVLSICMFVLFHVMPASGYDDQISSQAWKKEGDPQLGFIVLSSQTVIFAWTWSSLNPAVARKWAQLSVPVWPLAYTVFLTLFKELNLIWVRCMVVWVKSVTPSKGTQLHPLLLRQVIGWPLVSRHCVLIPL